MADGNFPTASKVSIKRRVTMWLYSHYFHSFHSIALHLCFDSIGRKHSLAILEVFSSWGLALRRLHNGTEITHKMSKLCTGNQEYTVLIFSPMPDQGILYTVAIIKPTYVYNLLLKTLNILFNKLQLSVNLPMTENLPMRNTLS